jgi:hypothetical protein
MSDEHGKLTYLDSGWPEQERRRIMSELRANSWSYQGIGRVFKVTPLAVRMALQLGTCGVCETPHFICSRQDWRKVEALTENG